MSIRRDVLRNRAHQIIRANRRRRAAETVKHGRPKTWKAPFRMAWEKVGRAVVVYAVAAKRGSGETARMRRAARRIAGPAKYQAVTT